MALHKERSNGTRDLIYLHHDYLGTVVAMTRGMGAQLGSILERQSFDPWGKKRSLQLATPMAGTFLSASANVSQGFTGHLQLGSSEAGANTLGFIHMGGRVYDPEIGRFLSPDPVLQFPESTQGFDRYAYVQNNPVSLTDPTGHLIAEIAAIAKVAWGVMTTKAVIQATVFAYSVVTGYMNGGIKGALFAVAGAGLSFGVGSLYSAGAVQSALGKAGTFFMQASTHGLVQGGLAAAQGGKFGAGFMSGFAGSSMGSVQFGSAKFQVSGLGRLTRVLQSAIAGGTASTLGGGKFANGAISGAIIMAWNHGAHEAPPKDHELMVVAEEGTPGHVTLGGLKPDGTIEGAGFYPTQDGFMAKVTDSVNIDGVRDGMINEVYDTKLVERAMLGEKGTALRVYKVDRVTYERAMGYMRGYAQANDYNVTWNNCVHATYRSLEFAGVYSGVLTTMPARPTDIAHALRR